MQSGWCYGVCERTGAKGDFPAQCVYSLPTITKPPAAVLVSYSAERYSDMDYRGGGSFHQFPLEHALNHTHLMSKSGFFPSRASPLLEIEGF